MVVDMDHKRFGVIILATRHLLPTRLPNSHTSSSRSKVRPSHRRALIRVPRFRRLPRSGEVQRESEGTRIRATARRRQDGTYHSYHSFFLIKKLV